MAKTTPQMSIHEIRLGKPKKNGETNMVKPNTPFDCPNDDLDFLQSAGACRDLTEDEASRFSGGSKAAAKADDSSDDEDKAKAEEARLALIQEAKDLGVKGVRKDWSAENAQAKIDEFKAAQEDDQDDDDQDDDDQDDDEDVVG